MEYTSKEPSFEEPEEQETESVKKSPFEKPKKKGYFPERYFEEYNIPKDRKEEFEIFHYQCDALLTGRITSNTVWCKNRKDFEKLVKRWNASEPNYKYYALIKESEDF